MPNTIFFLSAGLDDQQTLLRGLPSGSEWHLLDQNRNGLEEIAAVLSGRTEIDTLHLLSHGNAGMIQLGTLVLTTDNISDYASLLRQIGVALSAKGDIMLYGCHVAATAEGRKLVDSIARFTNANVAASSTLTGSAALGGDWNLDVRVGEVGSELLEVKEYSGVLLYVATVGSNQVILYFTAALGGPFKLPTTGYTLPPLSAFTLTGTAIAAGTTVTNIAIVNNAALGGAVILTLSNAIAAGTASFTYNPPGYIPGQLANSSGFLDNLTTGAVLAPITAQPVTVLTTALPTAPAVHPLLTLPTVVLTTATTLTVTYPATTTLLALGTGSAATAFTVVIDGVVSFTPSLVAVGAAALANTLTLTLPATGTLLAGAVTGTSTAMGTLIANGTHSVSVTYAPLAIGSATDLAAANINTATGTVAAGTSSNDLFPFFNVTSAYTSALNAASVPVVGIVNTAAQTPFTEKGLGVTINNPVISESDNSWYGGNLKVVLYNGETGDTLSLPTVKPNSTTSGVWIDTFNYVHYQGIGANGYIRESVIATLSQTGNTSTFTFTPVGNAAAIAVNGITYSGTVSDLAVMALASSIKFSSTAVAQTTLSRQVGYTFTDVLAAATVEQKQTITIAPVNDAPTLAPFTLPVVTGHEDTPVLITLLDLQAQNNATDPDGSVTAFVVQGVNTGTLKIGADAASATPFAAVTNDIIDATHKAFWTGSLNVNGANQNAFTVVARDNGTPPLVGSPNADQLPKISVSTADVHVNLNPVNDVPTFTAFNGSIVTAKENVEVPITFAQLAAKGDQVDAADVGGAVTSFEVTEVTSGTLKIGADAVSATPYDATTNKTIDATHIAYWTGVRFDTGNPANTVNAIGAFKVLAQDNGMDNGAQLTPATSATPVLVNVDVTKQYYAPAINPATLQVTADITDKGALSGHGSFDFTDYSNNTPVLSSSLGFSIVQITPELTIKPKFFKKFLRSL